MNNYHHHGHIQSPLERGRLSSSLLLHTKNEPRIHEPVGGQHEQQQQCSTSSSTTSYYHHHSQSFPIDSQSTMINMATAKRLARVFVDPTTTTAPTTTPSSTINAPMDAIHPPPPPHHLVETFNRSTTTTTATADNSLNLLNYDDGNTNIYTEPTIIDSNSNVLVEQQQQNNAPPPPRLLPPSLSNLANPNMVQQSSGVDCQYLQQQQQPQRPRDSLTIVGQDMAITVHQGQLTQTLLNNPVVPNGTGCNLNNNNNNTNTNHNYDHNNPQLDPQQILYYYSSHRMEFLPLCDLLFNIISLAAYFCDVVFDLVTAYTLYLNRQYVWFSLALFLILTSNIISQILSYRWYRRDQQNERNQLQKQLELIQQQQQLQQQRRCSNHLLIPTDRSSSTILITIHILFCGVLYRYFKLFAPVNLTTVKREVSELCILRMVHAFLQAGPMLLLQTFLIWRKPSLDSITDLNIISIFLSLFSICWALSSFNKNIRPEKIHKLVLTWFGVIFQFFWRIGTITSRIVALTVYAVLYEQWLFAVIFLHWFSMFLWLLSPHMLHLDQMIMADDHQPDDHQHQPQPGDPGRDSERNVLHPKRRRIFNAAALAWIYIFCFVNMEDTNARYRMLAFYATMFLENVLLLSISMFFDNRLAIPWYRTLAIFLVLGSFLMGMLFMWIYYRFFHIKNLKNSCGTNRTGANGIVNGNHQPNRIDLKNCINNMDKISVKEKSILNQLLLNQLQMFENKNIDPKLLPFANANLPMLNGHCLMFDDNNEGDGQNPTVESSIPGREASAAASSSANNIPGVFNCRLNPALKRKKKKPSTIPPLPHLLGPEMDVNKAKFGFKNTLGSISESVCNTRANFQNQKNALDSWKPGFQSKNLIHQIQRPMTNSSVLMRSYRQSPMDLLWNKSNQTARSLSISPSAMLKSNKSNHLQLMPPTCSNSSSNLPPTPAKNFIDKLDFVSVDHSNHHSIIELNPTSGSFNDNNNHNKKIIRPKPIVQHSINLDSISEINMNIDVDRPNGNYGNVQQQHPFEANNQQSREDAINQGVYNFYEYLNSLEKPSTTKDDSGATGAAKHDDDEDDYYGKFIPNGNDSGNLFMHRRPPVPGRESLTKLREDIIDDHSSYIEGKKSLLNCGKNFTDPPNKASKQGSRYYHQQQTSNKKRTRSNNKQNNSKNRAKSNHQQKYRPRSMDSAETSTDVSSREDFSSSGEDGDIESDVNHHHDNKMMINTNNRHNNANTNTNRSNNTMKTYQEIYDTTTTTTTTLAKQSNLYDRIHEDYDEAFGSEDGGMMADENHHHQRIFTNNIQNIVPDHCANNQAIYGRLGSVAAMANHYQAKIMDKYPSTSMLKNGDTIVNQMVVMPEINDSTTTTTTIPQRPRTMASVANTNGAKYKRYNTPL